MINEDYPDEAIEEIKSLRERARALEGVVFAVKGWVKRNHSFMSDGEVVNCVCIMCSSLRKLEEV